MMMRIMNITWILIGLSLSLPAMANEIRPIPCNHIFEVKQQIQSIAPNFEWNSPNCQIIGTRSLFPKKGTSGTTHFEKGLQVFVYLDKQLKFICVPGWVCKPW